MLEILIKPKPGEKLAGILQSGLDTASDFAYGDEFAVVREKLGRDADVKGDHWVNSRFDMSGEEFEDCVHQRSCVRDQLLAECSGLAEPC